MDRTTLVKDAGFSVRTKNILLSHSEDFGVRVPQDKKGRNIWNLTLGDMENFNVNRFKGWRGAGIKLTEEVIKTCSLVGINLLGVEKVESTCNTVITFDRFSPSGRLLRDLAKHLQQQDENILIESVYERTRVTSKLALSAGSAENDVTRS